MVMLLGEVKIGDFGFVCLFYKFFYSLFLGDKVVVMIWYCVFELLLGSRYYMFVIDMWVVGCIFVELFFFCFIFKGEEVKMDLKKMVLF